MNDIKNMVKYARNFFISSVIATILSIPVANAATEDETEFLKAAFSTKSETIKQLLEKGININYQNEMGADPPL